MSLDSFGTRATLTVGADTVDYFSLPALERAGYPGVARLPFSLKILLENLLRRIRLIPGVARSRTTVVLSTELEKPSIEIPVEDRHLEAVSDS